MAGIGSKPSATLQWSKAELGSSICAMYRGEKKHACSVFGSAKVKVVPICHIIYFLLCMHDCAYCCCHCLITSSSGFLKMGWAGSQNGLDLGSGASLHMFARIGSGSRDQPGWELAKDQCPSDKCKPNPIVLVAIVMSDTALGHVG